MTSSMKFRKGEVQKALAIQERAREVAYAFGDFAGINSDKLQTSQVRLHLAGGGGNAKRSVQAVTASAAQSKE